MKSSIKNKEKLDNKHKRLIYKLESVIYDLIKLQKKYCKNCNLNKKCNYSVGEISMLIYDKLKNILGNNFYQCFEKNLLDVGDFMVLQISNTGSMTPLIGYGDFLLIGRDNGDLKKGDIVLFIDDNRLIIHKITEMRKDGLIRIDSNITKNYPEIIIKDQVIGKVYNIIKPNSKYYELFELKNYLNN